MLIMLLSMLRRPRRAAIPAIPVCGPRDPRARHRGDPAAPPQPRPMRDEELGCGD